MERVGGAGPIAGTLGYGLARVCRAYRGSVGEALAGLGLHVGQEMFLMRLWEGDGITASDLAGRCGVEASTVSNTLGRLERAGLVERRRDAADARSSRVYLTRRGRELQGPVQEAWAEVEGRAFAGLSDEERRALGRLLLRVRANLVGDRGG